MKLLLATLIVSYVLDENLPPTPPPTDKDTEDLNKKRMKREEDELLCRGHILNTLSDRLYDLYTPLKSPKEIWDALEAKYITEKIGTDKFLTLQYFEFEMKDDVS